MARKSARIPAFRFFKLLLPGGNDGYCHAYSQASSAKENGSTIVSHSCQTSRWRVWRVTRFPNAITGSIDYRSTTHCEIAIKTMLEGIARSNLALLEGERAAATKS